MKTSRWMSLSLLFAVLIPSPSQACDFCMLGQGVSPYMTATGKGLTLDTHYMELDQVYDRDARVQSHGKTEAWTVYSLTGFYPVTDDLSLLATLPFVSKTNVDFAEADQSNPGTLTTGVADVTLTGRYTLFMKHDLDATLIGGLLAGVKFPTGTTGNRDARGEPVDRHALPGTGSWDFDLGFSGSYAMASGFQLTVDAVYRISTTGQWDGRDHRYGNMFNYGVKAFYRVARSEAGALLMPFVGVSGESTGREKGTDDPTSGGYDSARVNPSTGGTVLFADVGVYTVLGEHTMANLGFAKSFYRVMNFDPAFDADPSENYKVDLSITYLF